MSLTKVTKTPAQYHVFRASDLTVGCIIGVEDSLGKPSGSLIIESVGGTTIIQLNVCQTVWASQADINPGFQGAQMHRSPVSITELEVARDSIEIVSGAVFKTDMAVYDIKVVAFAPDIRITVAK